MKGEKRKTLLWRRRRAREELVYLENVSGRAIATGGCTDRIVPIIPARWTSRSFLNVKSWTNQVALVGDIAVGAADFHAPDLLGRFDLRKILDADLLLRVGTCFNEVRNCDGYEETKDRDNDHDFHEREAPSPGLEPCIDFHRFCFSRVFLAKQA